MTLSNALKEILHRSKLTQRSIAEKAHSKSASIIGAPIARNDLSVSTLVKLAHIAGYRVALVRAEPDSFNPELPIYIGCAGSVDVEGVKKEVKSGGKVGGEQES